jgi:hypothetical protein
MAEVKHSTRDVLKAGLHLQHSGFTKLEPGRYSANLDSWSYVALVGIHEELQKLNRLLACPNFIGIPKTLREIKRATNRIPTIAKPRKARAKK